MSLNIIPGGSTSFTVSSSSALYVLEAGETLAVSGNAIDVGSNDFVDLVIQGTILSGSDGITSDNDAVDLNIIVAQDASITGFSDGISVRASQATIVNYGEVYGTNSGGIELLATALPNGRSTIENYGSVYGGDDGIFVDQDNVDIFNAGTVSGDSGIYISSDGCRVFNSGIITSSNPGTSTEAGIEVFNFSTDYSLYLENTGLIQGSSTAISCADGSDRIINSGTISGTVDLNAGDDVYKGQGVGSAADGVSGEAGNDTLKGGDWDDLFDGGADDDVLRGGGGKDTLIGGGQDDDIKGGTGDDDINGNTGNDLLKGNDGDDSLVGEGGRDTLKGGDGADTLIGGKKQDILLGGDGADVFIFEAADQSAVDGERDQIRDFESGVDVIDVSQIASMVFIGTAGFSGTQAELRLDEKADGSTTIRIDADGDGVTDSTIKVTNAIGLGEDDFIL